MASGCMPLDVQTGSRALLLFGHVSGPSAPLPSGHIAKHGSHCLSVATKCSAGRICSIVACTQGPGNPRVGAETQAALLLQRHVARRNASRPCLIRPAPLHCAQGPSDHTLAQIKDAIRDGLRAVANTLLDRKVVRGAGAFEASTRFKALQPLPGLGHLLALSQHPRRAAPPAAHKPCPATRI